MFHISHRLRLVAPFLSFVVMTGIAAPAAHAQAAICECCQRPYRVPGATWIGTSRNYGGLCRECRGICLGCKGEADYLRALFNGMLSLRQSGRLNELQTFVLNQAINGMEQRWADLRRTCLAAGGDDIGAIHPRSRKPIRPLGLNTAEAKDRLRDEVKTIENDLADFILEFDENAKTGKDTALDNALVSVLREANRLADILSQITMTKIGPQKAMSVPPPIKPLPKAEMPPTAAQLLRRAATAQMNSNACAHAFLSSREQFFAAKKNGDKNAMSAQVTAMGKFAHQADNEARKAASFFRAHDELRLKQIEAHRAALAKKGINRQEERRQSLERFRKGWPSRISKALDAAGVSPKRREVVRLALIARTVEADGKTLAQRKAKFEIDSALRKLLAKNKMDSNWPEPPHIFALEFMKQQSHLLHAELQGRLRQLP